MCGIAGIVRFDRPATESRAALGELRARLRHRGPDGEGEACGSFAAVAHTRLAMVDRVGGAQPMRSADGRYLLVYNGELYNHAALRAELGGPWRTGSDTETLVAAWERWGVGCLPKLDGMFAFFVWDERMQEGFAVRDRLGVKPLAYWAEDGAWIFASEAHALLRLRAGPPRANLDAIVEYLVAPAFSGVARSPFAGISYLAPGHLAHVTHAGASLRRWWRWEPMLEASPDAEALARQTREALGRSVASCLRSDVPLGIFSSGGLDSSAIAALAHPTLRQAPAFTVTFEGQEAWGEGSSALVVSNDTPYARDVAAAFSLEPVEVAFERENLRAELQALARTNDALPAWEQELSQRTLARAAAQRVKGVLVGDASDELHYGYHFLLDELSVRRPEAILAKLGGVPVRPEVDAAPVGRFGAEYRRLMEEAGGRFEGWDACVLATTRLIVERWLPRLLHNGDIHCMAFGLEARVPFASLDVLKVAARVPPRLGLEGGVEKAVLRRAMRGVLPERIRLRRKSALPKDQNVGALYQEELRGILEAPHPLVSAVVDLPALRPLMRGPLGERDRASLFRVISLHHWAFAHEVQAP